MISRVAVVTLLIMATVCASISYERSLLDYNENGVYFDGVTTYDTDAVVGFGFVAALLFIAATIIALIAGMLKN